MMQQKKVIGIFNTGSAAHAIHVYNLHVQCINK